MRLKIIHETEYQFTSEVFFEPHYLRFKPRNTPYLVPESFNLQISPEPVGISEHIDAENNLVDFCWFEGMYNKLHIRSELLCNTQLYNPFNFFLYPAMYSNLPFDYNEELKDIIQGALKVEKISSPLHEYGVKLLNESKANTVEFLTRLTRQIHDDFYVVIREKGIPLEPEITFSLKKGSCRDLAWMQIQLLRYFGIASRFVSGYYYLVVENPEFELHAWLEVFLPGAGWIGFDPSHGIIVANTHIPVASSAFYENTMSVSGSVRGNAASDLKTNLKIETIN
jgi:transglutaminase-like putative cysteine protease